MFGRKQLSDEEYVEQVRKNIRAFRRIQWFWPCFFVFLMFSLVSFIEHFRTFTTDYPVEKQLVYTGMFLGAAFGLLLSGIALQAVLCISHWIEARSGFRTVRLMLKYHDELKATQGHV